MIRLLNHLRGNLNPGMIIPLHGIRLDVDSIHVKVPLLRVQLRLQPLRAVRRPPGAGLPAVAAGGHERGEDAADDGAEEGEGGADDGDVAFCCGPVGGADVAVWVLLVRMLCMRMSVCVSWAYKMCRGFWQQCVDWRDEGHLL